MMLLLLGLACVNSSTRLMELSLSLNLEAEPGLEGPVYGELMHTWYGEGALRVALIPFDAFEAPGLGPLTLSTLVPVDEGEGLSVYAWLDLDGDGLLCAPGVQDEPAGLVEVTPFPAYEAQADLKLEALCAGPEALFP